MDRGIAKGAFLIEKLKILAVDDEPMILDFIEKYLSRKGCEVQTAGDAESALEQLESFEPDVLLLDVSLPGMSGCELAKKIGENERWSDIPVVFLSGYSREGATAQSYLTKDSIFVKKPFDGATLVETVHAAVGI